MGGGARLVDADRSGGEGHLGRDVVDGDLELGGVAGVVIGVGGLGADGAGGVAVGEDAGEGARVVVERLAVDGAVGSTADVDRGDGVGARIEDRVAVGDRGLALVDAVGQARVEGDRGRDVGDGHVLSCRRADGATRIGRLRRQRARVVSVEELAAEAPAGIGEGQAVHDQFAGVAAADLDRSDRVTLDVENGEVIRLDVPLVDGGRVERIEGHDRGVVDRADIDRDGVGRRIEVDAIIGGAAVVADLETDDGVAGAVGILGRREDQVADVANGNLCADADRVAGELEAAATGDAGDEHRGELVCRRVVRVAEAEVGCGEGVALVLVDRDRVVGTGRRVVDRCDGDRDRVHVGQGATGTGVPEVIGGDGELVRAVEVGGRVIAQPRQRGADAGKRARECHEGVTAPVTGTEGEARRAAERQRAVVDLEGDLDVAGCGIDVADANEVAVAGREHQRGILVGGLWTGHAVDRSVVDARHRDRDGGDVAVR